MRLSANFKMILAAAATLAMLGVGASAMAQDLSAGVQAQSGPRLDFPAGLATDGRAVYVANSRNNTVEAIDPASRTLRIVAGTLFQEGSNDGTGPSARFNSPDGMTMSGQNLYLCDTNNSDIRQISISGTVTTVAGQANIAGTEDGTGAGAHFNLPTQFATDGTALYVADSGNSTIRRITLADFKVKTIAGQAGTSGKTEGGPDNRCSAVRAESRLTRKRSTFPIPATT